MYSYIIWLPCSQWMYIVLLEESIEAVWMIKQAFRNNLKKGKISELTLLQSWPGIHQKWSGINWKWFTFWKFSLTSRVPERKLEIDTVRIRFFELSKMYSVLFNILTARISFGVKHCIAYVYQKIHTQSLFISTCFLACPKEAIESEEIKESILR